MLRDPLKSGIRRKFEPQLIVLFTNFLLSEQGLATIVRFQGSLFDSLDEALSSARLVFPRSFKVTVFVIACHQHNYNYQPFHKFNSKFKDLSIKLFLTFLLEALLIIYIRMAKKTFYFSNPHKKLSHLLNEMSHHQIENTNKHLKELLNKKKAKLKEIYSLTSHEVMQPKMLPMKQSYGSFMDHVPMAVVEEYTDEKVKANILKPDRFYASQPNVKAGSFMLPKRASITSNRTIVNAEFQEYNRIMDQQSGQYKHKKIIKLLSLHEDAKGKPKYSRMKKTLFQKFIPDKYNLYENPMCFKKSTTFESAILKKSQSKHLKSEESLESSNVKNELSSSKQIRTIDMELSQQGRRSRKISVIQKSRIRTNSIRENQTQQKTINNS